MPTSGQPDDAARHAALVEALQAYLVAHPMAADSADGIARWWLPAGSVRPTPAEVERAVATLVARAVLRSVALAEGSVIYMRADDGASH